jgi:flagellar basal-body rod protein FlgF
VSTGIWIAASGAVSQLTSLDVTANNVANSATAGYKAEQVAFSERLLSAAQAGRSLPAIRVTDRGLDVAIRGPGFIAVQGPSGERYTRAGDLQTDATGALRTSDGSLVLDAARKPLRLPMNGGEASIGTNGEVLVGGENVGQLRLVQFDAPNQLTKVGHSLYQATAAAGPARAEGVELEPGALEMSNANPVKGMTDMVTITRAFDALQNVIDTFKTVEQRAATSLMGRR